MADRAAAEEQETGTRGVFGPGDPLSRLPRIPWFFLGIACYRAWLEIAFIDPAYTPPDLPVSAHNVLDGCMVVALLACAAAAGRISPLFNRPPAYLACAALLVVGTGGTFAAGLLPGFPSWLGMGFVACGGVGTALLILLWSELYGCLNPLRVVLYYAASIMLAGLLVLICRGFLLPWLVGAALVLPLVSLLAVLLGFRSLPPAERPAPHPVRSGFPWKPVLLMAVYGFAYGLEQASIAGELGSSPHSAGGTVFVGAVVFVGVLLRGERFDFSLMYRAGLPLMIGAFLLLPSFGFLGSRVSHFCATASYAAFQILIMLVLANICRRYGTSAVWLFGFERGLRSICIVGGRQTGVAVTGLELPFDPSLIVSALIVLLVAAMTMLLLSERELGSRWGLTLHGDGGDANPGREESREELVERRCRELAARHGLSMREKEVVELLAQHKTAAEIGQELFISAATAKTHARNIYRKLGVHSREELVGLLEPDGGGSAAATGR